MPATPIVAEVAAARMCRARPTDVELDYPNGPRGVPVNWTLAGVVGRCGYWRAQIPETALRNGIRLRIGTDGLSVMVSWPQAPGAFRAA